LSHLCVEFIFSIILGLQWKEPNHRYQGSLAISQTHNFCNISSLSYGRFGVISYQTNWTVFSILL